VGGSVFLRKTSQGESFQARGETSLYGVKIGSDLACDGGLFLNPDGHALDAGGVTVGGTVFLHNSFWAKGEVGLYRAGISGNLQCDGGVFLNPNGRALGVGGATVGGTVSLRKTSQGEGFRAEGEVGLYGAKIGGSLACEGGLFLNPDGRALNAGGVTVGGSVFLRKTSQGESFQARGEVGLYETRITGMLDCTGGVFLNPGEGKYALNANAVVVGGDTFLRYGFQAEGLVRLVGANIGTHLDFSRAQFIGKPSNGLLAEKIVVKGLFDWRQVTPTDETILSLWGARVGQLADDKESWPKPGKRDLDDFVYATIANGPMDAAARVCWLERQASQPLDPPFDHQPSQSTLFKPKPYQHLAKVLRESGHEAEAKRILIAKERAQWKRRDLGWLARCRRRILGWILGWTMVYGYKPGWLLLWALALILLGGWLFGAGYQAGAMVRTKKAEGNTPYPTFSPLMYSLDTFLPIINFGQKDYWWPEASGTPSPAPPQLQLASSVELNSLMLRTSEIAPWVTSVEFLRVYRWIHIGIGWLLITLGIVGVTGLIRKE